MRVIFGGPTFHGANLSSNSDYQLRPPARQGDIFKAVEEGANVIGLVDGVYEYVPAVWHKEILFGLAQGVHVFGAASLGALRAAECAPFGMVGVGQIYREFASGALEDDAEVAQSHGPAELDFLPLSEALVNVRATLARCLQQALITPAEHDLLLAAAQATFFKDRTYKRLVSSAIAARARAEALLAILRENRIDQKRRDAEMLIDAVVSTPDSRHVPQWPWRFEKTSIWEAMFPSR